MKRIKPLVTGEVYHIFSRSIADYKIFNSDGDYLRITNLLQYYQIKEPPTRFSFFLKLPNVQRLGFQKYFLLIAENQNKLVEIIAYCLMPNHLHLILKQLKDKGISLYMGKLLNSYSHYFNIKHQRKGPLWESKFKNVLVEDDDQLFHLTRYIHLNPVTSFLVERPQQWRYSSYSEYISKNRDQRITCADFLEINPLEYKKFVEDQISYQRELARIKKLILD